MKRKSWQNKTRVIGLGFLLFVFISSLFQPLVVRAVDFKYQMPDLKVEDIDLPKFDEGTIQPHLISGEWQNQFLHSEKSYDENKVKDNLSADLYSGAVTYKYPFDFPAGRSGLNPNLYLSYNSQNLRSESAYGYGWELAGILSIQRNFSDGVDSAYENNRFVFSGGGDLIPVVLTDEVHGEYLLNIDNGDYLRFIYQNNDNWKVIDKQGVIYYLGSISESREGANGQNAIWKIDKIQDKSGNYILFRYENLNGIAWLSRITYTHWGLDDPLYEIRFFYSSRQNYQKSFRYGFLQNYNRKLQNIQVSSEGVAYKNYQFDLQENAGILLLKSIVHKAKNTTTNQWQSLPSSNFEYNLPIANNWQVKNVSSVPFSLDYYNGLELADVNNDGYSDVLISNDLVSSSNQITNERKTYLHNKNNGFTDDISNYHLPVPLFIKRQGGFSFFTDYNLFDINGDSYLDIAKNNSVFLFNKNTQGWFLNSNYSWLDYWFFKDNVAVEIGANHDFNGDGLPDYVNLKTKSVYLNKWNTNKNDLLSGWTDLPSALLDSSYKTQGVRLVDLNGDGLTDIIRSKLYTPTNGWSRFVYLNRGNGEWLQENYDFVSPLAFCKQYYLTTDCLDNKVLFIDINQDGLPDLLDSAGKFYLNNGHGWSTTSAGQWNLPFSLLDGTEWTKFRFAEADGRPGVDLWKSGAENGGLFELSFHQNPSPHVYLLNKISNEKGAQIFIEYESSSHYLNNGGMPFSVLKKVLVDDGLGQRLLEEYEYQGSHYYFDNVWQRWRSGFGFIKKFLSNNRVEHYYFHQGNGNDYPFEINDDISKRGKLFYWEILENNQPLRGNLNIWQKINGRPNHYLILKTHDWIFYFGANYPRPAHSILLTSEYDNKTGNLISSTDWGLVTYISGREWEDLNSNDNRREAFTYAIDKAGNVRDKISSRQIINNNNQIQLHEKFLYDNLAWGSVNKGLMTKHSLLGANNIWINENFVYNNYGLNTKYLDFNGNVYDYSYDVYNYYSNRSSNPLGHLQTSTYNYFCGLINSETDLNGVSVIYDYDPFCRPIEIRRELGTVSEILQRWQYFDDNFPTSVNQQNYLSPQNWDESKTYFDGLGRPLLRLKKQSNYLWTAIISQYDHNGLLIKQSLPFDTTTSNWQIYQANVWENFTYDTLYRLVAWNNERENFTIQYQDFGKRFLYLNNQLWGEYEFDSRDNLRSVKLSNGQYYIYQYDILNRLVKLTDSNGNFRRIVYDFLGQVTSIDDWHGSNDNIFSRWFYTWDANGNLLQKSLSNGQKIIYRYDRLNRLLQEDDLSTPDLDYLYLYDGSNYGKGNLSGIKNQDISVDYIYDWRGFIIKETYLLKGLEYTYQYVRNYNEQPVLIIYPDQSSLEYVYNGQGLLTSANYKDSLETKNIISGRHYNNFGAVVLENLGNSTQRSFRYDNYGVMTGESVLKNGQILWQQNYTYDQWKNLRGLNASGNLFPNYQAVFSYDNSHRLNSYNFIATDNQVLANGNYSYNEINGLRNADNKNYQYENNLSSLISPYAPISNTGLGINWQASYDELGNVDNLGPYKFFWDTNSRLRSVDYQNGQVEKTFYYRSDGQRLLAERNNGSLQIWLDNYYEDTASAYKQISYGPLQKQNNRFIYQYYDKFDNLTLELDEIGQLENYYVYDPKGNIILQQNNRGAANFYHQQWRDVNEENLDYKGGRYYSAEWQHYLSPDPAHLDFSLLSWEEQQQMLVNPIRLNPYIYLAHNPYQNRDDSNAWLETVWDVVSLGLSIKDFIAKPSWGTALSVGLDLISVVTPFVPAFGQVINKGTNFLVSKFSKLAVKYQNEIRKTARYLNQSAEKVWGAMRSRLGEINNKLGRKINKYWRGGIFDDVNLNFVEHYVKHGGELSQFGIKSMDDYLEASVKFIGMGKNKIIVNEFGTFHRMVHKGDTLFFNPHNNLLAILGTDKSVEYVKSFYEVTDPSKIKKLFNNVIGRSSFWLFDLLLGRFFNFKKTIYPVYSCP